VSLREKFKHVKVVAKLGSKLDLKDFYAKFPLDDFLQVLRLFLVDPVRSNRVVGLKAVRHLAIRDAQLTPKLEKYNIDKYIAFSIERGEDTEGERLEAIKIVRAMIDSYSAILSSTTTSTGTGSATNSPRTTPTATPTTRSGLNASGNIVPHSPRVTATGPVPALGDYVLPRAVFASLQAVVDSTGPERDPLALVSCELIGEAMLCSPVMLSELGVVRTVLNAVVDAHFLPIQQLLLTVLLVWLNHPRTRALMQPSLDLGTLLAPLTDPLRETFKPASNKEPSAGVAAEKSETSNHNTAATCPQGWVETCRAVSYLLRYWPGLLALCSHPQGLQSLITALTYNHTHHPSLNTLHTLLDLFYEVFRIPLLNSGQALDRRLGGLMGFNADPSQTSTAAELGPDADALAASLRPRYRMNLLWNYTACMLSVMVQHGLIEQLILLGNQVLQYQASVSLLAAAPTHEYTGMTPFRTVYTKVTVLLGELLHLSNRLLSPHTCARLQQLPTLVQRAIMFRAPKWSDQADQSAQDLEEKEEEREQVRDRERASGMVSVLHKWTSLKSARDSVLYSSLAAPSTPATLPGPSISSPSSHQRRGSIGGRADEIKSGALTPSADPRDSTSARLDRVSEVKRKMEWQMDETAFLVRIKETTVTLVPSKEYDKWKWDLVHELLEGPMRNPTLLQLALKTKWYKRLLSFLKPQKHLFSKLRSASSNDTSIYVRVAQLVMEVLVEHDTGRMFLQEHSFLKCLSQLFEDEYKLLLKEHTHMTNTQSSADDLLLSRNSLLKTLSREYFSLIGILTRSYRGQEVLKKHKLFKSLQQICELEGRDDLIRLVLTNIDYNSAVLAVPQAADVHLTPRTSRDTPLLQAVTNSNAANVSSSTNEALEIIRKILASSSTVVKYFAVRHLRTQLHAKPRAFSEWGIELLLTKLMDNDVKIRGLVHQILDEAIDHTTCLDKLIDLLDSPAAPIDIKALVAMGTTGTSLLIRLLSTAKGLTKLLKIDFVAPQMKRWIESENDQYVLVLEKKMQTVLTKPLTHTILQDPTNFNPEGEVLVPPHLFGELAKTDQGCELIRQGGYITQLLQVMSSEQVPSDSIKKRGALWALGHVGSSESGSKLLDLTRFVTQVIDLAEHSECPSLRGTAFMVLGTLTTQPASRELLSSLGWETSNLTDLETRIALPVDMSKTKLFTLPIDTPLKGAVLAPLKFTVGLGGLTAVGSEILTLVSQMSNLVTADKSYRALKRLKSKASHADEFKSPRVLLDVFRLVTFYKFRLKHRRLIQELFNQAIFNSEILADLDKLTAQLK
jgi:hypothetical protein